MEQGVASRVRSTGVLAASAIDLLAIGIARDENDANATVAPARELLVRIGRLQNLAQISAQDLIDTGGLEPFDSLKVQALIELGRRVGKAGKGESQEVGAPVDVFRLLEHLRFEKREHFIAVLLDAKNQVIRVAPIHVGTLTMSLVGPRELFREAIRDGASSVIIAHNHPSGDPTPSPEDIDMTRKLVEIGRMLDIPIVDHVIIGETPFSFNAKRLL